MAGDPPPKHDIITKMMPPGCIKKLGVNRDPVIFAANSHKEDASDKGSISKATLKFFADFDIIHKYVTTGSGDQRREFCERDETLYKSMDFKKQGDDLIKSFKDWYDPYKDQLPDLYGNWGGEFDLC